MLVTPIVIALCTIVIVVLTTVSVEAPERGRMLQVMIFGYALRLALFVVVMRNVAFFSHGHAASDSLTYEFQGSMIAQLWRFGHVHFVTESEMPSLGQVALPCNVLALLEFVGGAPAPLAGTAINAMFACWTALIVYRFIRDGGADASAALRITLLVFFGPSFLYHTSDTYKDGINAFLVIAGLVNAMRLAQSFSLARVFYLVVPLVCLWFVRHYMVFMCLGPLSLGILGVGRASVPRRIAAGTFMFVILAALLYSGRGSTALESAATTYAQATNQGALAWNAGGGSYGHGVAGSGVVTSNYAEALLYTIFSPFPWQLGSVGLQLGKIEAFIFYYFMYTAYRHRKRLWAEHRSLVLMLLMFIVPATLAYAMTMSNVGLIVRQRMPIVIAVAVLAGLALRVTAEKKVPASAAGPSSPARRGDGATPSSRPAPQVAA